MEYDLQIRQNFSLGPDGDRVVIQRVLLSDHRVYLEMSQTEDAREVTIMRAVTDAIDNYGGEHGGEEKEDRQGR